MKLPRSSIGRGNMMVEFFSADMVARVCRYLHTDVATILEPGQITKNKQDTPYPSHKKFHHRNPKSHFHSTVFSSE
jgi:hypothetical protein